MSVKSILVGLAALREARFGSACPRSKALNCEPRESNKAGVLGGRSESAMAVLRKHVVFQMDRKLTACLQLKELKPCSLHPAQHPLLSCTLNPKP